MKPIEKAKRFQVLTKIDKVFDSCEKGVQLGVAHNYCERLICNYFDFKYSDKQELIYYMNRKMIDTSVKFL